MAYNPSPFPDRSRKREQDIDNRTQPFHQFLIALAKAAEGLSLHLEHVREGLGTVTADKLRGEGMRIQRFSRDLLVFALGNFKDCCKVVRRACCLVAFRHEGGADSEI